MTDTTVKSRAIDDDSAANVIELLLRHLGPVRMSYERLEQLRDQIEGDDHDELAVQIWNDPDTHELVIELGVRLPARGAVLAALAKGDDR